jgi:hypothetical protein
MLKRYVDLLIYLILSSFIHTEVNHNTILDRHLCNVVLHNFSSKLIAYVKLMVKTAQE